MITECFRDNFGNDSIVDSATVFKYDQLETDTNSSELSHGSTSREPQSVQEKTALIDSNYIESKIKCLLNGERAELHSSEKSENEESRKEIRGILITEDSCNAVDHKISNSLEDEKKVSVEDLSFNGKINCFNGKMSDTSPRSNAENVELNHSDEKLRRDKFNESFEMLTKENSSLMHYTNEKSPDLFDDDDSAANDLKSDTEDIPLEDRSFNTSILSSSIANSACPAAEIERVILKRLQGSLSGVLPPPSVTFSNIDVNRMLTLYRENEARYVYRHDQPTQESKEELNESSVLSNCLSRPTHTRSDIEMLGWPELLMAKGYGLHYNRSTVSEKIELLGLKYIDRYIGAETSSTFNITHSPSSSKKRNLRLKMLNQSPGRRLSHLARRRAIFSSANLLCSSGSTTKSASMTTSQTNPLRLCNRQILLDPKSKTNRRKSKGRTPKRRTPSRRNTPRRKTPGSSAKKRVMSLPVTKLTQHPVSRETSKRALFQSPSNDNSKPEPLHKPGISSVLTDKIQKSKRALFSPPKRIHRFASVSIRQDSSVKESLMSSQQYGSTNNIDMLREQTIERIGKRRRSIDEEENVDAVPSVKMPKLDKEDLTPRSLKFARSQSFCVGSQNLNTKNASESGLCGKSLFRANSEVAFPDSVARPVTTLSENHKKKLLWAVSQSLQTKQISVKHESFKHYASNLARVVRRLFLEFDTQLVASTSEKLLRLANKHVFEVIQGNSVDDIYLREKTRIMSARNISKLQGYIGPEEYEQRNRLLKRSTSICTATSESSNDRSPFISSSQQLSQSSIFSQSSEFLNQLSQTSVRSSQVVSSTAPVAVATDSTISENTILRENVNNEQRQKSAQKQISFSGKDQKNLSPYADSKAGSQAKTKILVGGMVTSSIMKAKRQISFE
ncbi:uncharacterized protein LOC129769285 [Toxorhynchites rutilus septentrionalis]|uniref:uncharacterized protein LOC129769285 n=1 Tax=Toxorhynchites rutilus septentrionalis TaxID=329112 RepID=UPI002479FCD2|nr:uncharacterized protein LOC129769285 [Toxorhynchites rutilus septentrionalis]XP_055627395.1 uncharacterized protein LOC129769285 [Toxorhynchites rutilus septentrionalis]XP_055627396.1 uncharacterized protein LOC129769285 [Toxorhynchites rutilus septentrionalis]